MNTDTDSEIEPAMTRPEEEEGDDSESSSKEDQLYLEAFRIMEEGVDEAEEDDQEDDQVDAIILDDSETNDWLSSRQSAKSRQAVLDNPETNDWMPKKRAKEDTTNGNNDDITYSMGVVVNYALDDEPNKSPLPMPQLIPHHGERITSQPGAHAVHPTGYVPPTNGNRQPAMTPTLTTPPASLVLQDTITHHQDDQRDDDILLGLAEAQPVTDQDRDRQQAKPMFHYQSGCPLWKIGTLALVGLVLLGGILAGGICGSGLCSSEASSSVSDTTLEKTMAPTSSYRDAIEARDLEWEIKYVLGRDYFDKGSREQTRDKALHWLLYEDPLQLQPSDSQHLLRRFILVLLYFQTTQKDLWTECNPTQDSKSTFCYYPVEDPFSSSNQLWGSHWLSASHECQWAGVSCSGISGGDRNVTELKLRYNNLNGPLSLELSKLVHLEVLELSHNKLTGTIPTELGLLDYWIDALNLNNNKLEGTVPTELFGTGYGGNYTWRQLNLASNSLTGSIPTEVGRSKWVKVDLRENVLSGSLPMELFGSTSLRGISIERNRKIEGVLPSQVGQLTALSSLYIAHTGISGLIPTEVALLKNLQELRAANTNLGGPIPEALYWGLSNLRKLDISGCHFSGTISSSLRLWSDLYQFRIANNEFTGLLPDEIGSLTNLHNITLNGNDFTTESVPDALCAHRTPLEGWELVADCLPESTTGNPLMTCPSTCCTRCCSQETSICQAN